MSRITSQSCKSVTCNVRSLQALNYFVLALLGMKTYDAAPQHLGRALPHRTHLDHFGFGRDSARDYIQRPGPMTNRSCDSGAVRRKEVKCGETRSRKLRRIIRSRSKGN